MEGRSCGLQDDEERNANVSFTAGASVGTIARMPGTSTIEPAAWPEDGRRLSGIVRPQMQWCRYETNLICWVFV